MSNFSNSALTGGKIKSDYKSLWLAVINQVKEDLASKNSLIKSKAIAHTKTKGFKEDCKEAGLIPSEVIEEFINEGLLDASRSSFVGMETTRRNAVNNETQRTH